MNTYFITNASKAGTRWDGVGHALVQSTPKMTLIGMFWYGDKKCCDRELNPGLSDGNAQFYH